ncbi:PQ loop repeat-domain-containing protein, partial [Mortierella sp. GBAus27b]
FLDVGMVIGPVTGYIHQYYTIYMQKTSRGFSSATCGVLLFAKASRPHAIGWFRETAEQWAFTFWNWPTIWPYFIFIIIYTSVLSVLMYFFGNKSLFVECLGFVALGIEATVPMPQAIHNYHTKSTVGFSPSIVLMWVIGDSVKMYYFISQHAKFQFIGCGAVQLCVDVVIIVQTIIYSKWWKRRM